MTTTHTSQISQSWPSDAWDRKARLMSSIAVIGTGYVGLITGAGFADLGNDVVCVDILEEKIAKLRAGAMPFFEPGLEELVRRTSEAGRLRFTTDYAQAIPGADFVFITVDPPPS